MPFPKPNRAMLFDSAGLACYIAWSFVFWNGSVLFGDLRHEAPVGEAQIVQAALTALAALVLVLLARRTAPLRRRTVLLAVFAAVSSLAIVVAALAGFGRAPMGWMLIAFALSGLGSTLRLGWEERMSVQGVERTAVCAGTAYLLGFLLFALISLLPALSVLAVSVLLPFGAFGLLAIAVRGERERGASEVSSEFHGALAGVPALASFVAILLAYLFYRKNAMLAFYLAFPLMAMASLLPASLDPFGGGTTFSVALVGAELVKYLVWFLLIDSFFKDGLSALLCLALMRFAQWGGSCLGQIVTDVLPTSESVAIAILLSLMAALLVIMGSPLSLKSPAVVEEDAVDALALRVKRVAVQCGLSPREQEVLAIWATGHTGAYIEKQLFISKNTVKTHLNHIYAKTKTANREELLELLESVDAG